MDREDPAPVRLILAQVPQKKSLKEQAMCGSLTGASIPGGGGLGSVVRREGELAHVCAAGTASPLRSQPETSTPVSGESPWERNKPVALVNGQC